jgi:hypothetical protein
MAETFKSVNDKMMYGTESKLVNMFHAGNVKFTYEDLNTSIDKPENHSISTLFHKIPQHPERNDQSTAKSHTVRGVLGCLMNSISTTLKTACAGKLQCMSELDSSFKSLQHQQSIHLMAGVIR